MRLRQQELRNSLMYLLVFLITFKKWDPAYFENYRFRKLYCHQFSLFYAIDRIKQADTDFEKVSKRSLHFDQKKTKYIWTFHLAILIDHY